VSDISAGTLVVFYLFEVADAIDLPAIPALIGGAPEPARLAPKPATPGYVQYDRPPQSFDGEILGVPDIAGFRIRLRLYDYGILSVGLSRPFEGSWADLPSLGQTVTDNAELERRAGKLCRTVLDRVDRALKGRRAQLLTEDYVVFAVSELATPTSADELLAMWGNEIAATLRGERMPLSMQEREAVLQRRISYLADDLVVPTWNAAFVFDTQAGVQATLEIIEFANSQLLQLRYYDDLLSDKLTSIYAEMQRPRWYDQWRGSHYTRAARQVHSLFIEVNELTDRAENALKFIGDIYAARVFALVGDRLALGAWKADVEAKLKTLDDIYRFAVEQSSMSRGEFLELTIVLILVFELVLIFLGVMN
jgi:hypothetical protein